jgi:DNA-binding transcriptional LysR family regulator
MDGSSFNDIGLMCDAAAQGLGIGLVRTKLGAPWLDNGQLVRLYERSVPSPHAHYLCWRTGTMDRWECATFADWLQHALT